VKRAHLWLIAFAAIAPRLAVLVHERGRILTAFTDKSDDFAQTFVHHGTFGFIPGEPSAYTQPLYGFFLVPIYWIFGRTWWAVGGAQIVVAAATAFLVYAIGTRVSSRRAGTIAAVLATLNPYLVWHDVHVNREIVDQTCAAALVLLTLLVVERRSARLAVLLGVAGGLAMLGNSRLVFLPILVAAYLVWRMPRTGATALVVALVLAGAAVAVAPWLVRNKVAVGCWALTTDGRALWKANNTQTYALLSNGLWIDDVKHPPRQKGPNYYTPDDARTYYEKGLPTLAHNLYPDECAQMSFFEHRTFLFWRRHPGEKLKLMALSTKLLWQPSVFETSGRNGAGNQLDVGRSIVEPVYMWALYALAAVGLFLAPRAFVALALLLLGYQTAAALAFVGATRYRVAWDFLLVLLATATLARAAEWARARRTARA